ncbi:MAG: ATP-binding protein [Elusimicrobiota bacterium]|jgi:hypothetical protein|nr:ATP-binding protein [Elusimicrobiota bacterium]
MKNIIIKDGNAYNIMQGNSFDISEELPNKIFILNVNKFGYFLEEEQSSEFNLVKKFYGDVEKQTSRILSTFKIFKNNLGVLFSGPKGLGKSLTIRNICDTAIKDNFPVILIKENLGNVSDFIQKIVQPCIVVFDEFEKTYKDYNKEKSDDLETQDSMLDLFDSTMSGKKLFLLSCNSVNDISEFLLSRPGRIHYHFKFNRVKIAEVRQYCRDNLKEEYFNLIEDICMLSTKIADFSFDMLKAITFEINNYGTPIKELEEILNLSNNNDKSCYEIIIETDIGIYTAETYINLSRDCVNVRLSNDKFEYSDFTFNFTKCKWTGREDGSMEIDSKYIIYRNKDNERCNPIKCLLIPKKSLYLSGLRNDEW